MVVNTAVNIADPTVGLTADLTVGLTADLTVDRMAVANGNIEDHELSMLTKAVPMKPFLTKITQKAKKVAATQMKHRAVTATKSLKVMTAAATVVAIVEVTVEATVIVEVTAMKAANTMEIIPHITKVFHYGTA